ncbi:hypothetical protein OQJ59_11850, partial [Microbulbifer thermotolerans]|uniref:hypothetical protein n=1 Tax=Microbulbifer thermotolerans TaxID=252514 RepID=UPI00224AC8F2
SSICWALSVGIDEHACPTILQSLEVSQKPPEQTFRKLSTSASISWQSNLASTTGVTLNCDWSRSDPERTAINVKIPKRAKTRIAENTPAFRT